MKWILFLLVVVYASLVSSQALAGFEKNQYRERVAIHVKNAEEIFLLKRAEIEIDHCSREEFTVYAYATPEEVQLIQYLGFPVIPAPVTIGRDSKAVAYHTYDTLTSELQSLASAYPQLAKLSSLGKSTEKRELWVMKISDNVATDECEPEVKYVSTMHGDEVVGQEMCVYLIRLLLEKYGKDERITKLVDDLEIWIVCDMNPDGTALKRRYNAQWVDLNRNFPDVQSDPTNDPTGRATETQLMMKFTAEHNFCLSLNYHGGAVVVNYPWDTKAGDVPDIAFTKHLSLGYSKLNSPMYHSTSFKDGITNGYDWYEVNSGMQDWNYHWHNCLDLTIEVSQQKWPNADTLPQYWQENQASMLWCLAQARRGIHGVVKDKNSGNPIAAKIEVTGIAKSLTASPTLGDYHKLLMPGTYTVKFSAPGYQDYVASNILVEDNDTKLTVVNVTMQAK